MSLKDKASQIFKPSRYKATKLYAYRGQDLTSVGRSSVATRVNSSGLIEEVAVNIPRLNYDPEDLSKCPSFLFEESRTNSFTSSEDGSAWEVNGSSVITNAIKSPDGNNTGNKLTYDGGSYSFARKTYASGAGVFSVFAKRGNHRYVGIRNSHVSGVHSVFDFDSEKFTLVQSGHTCSFVKYPNGWYRLIDYQSVTVSPTSAYRSICIAGSDGNENGTDVPTDSYVYFWGAQGEFSKVVPSSYIKTTGSSATRSNDLDLSIGLSEVGTAVTLYLDYKVKNTNPSRFMYGIFNGNSTSSAPYAAIYQASTQILNDGTLYTAAIGGNSDGDKKLVIRIDGTSVSYFLNGKKYSAPSFTNTLSNPYFLINYGIDKEQQLTEYLIYPEALSDEDCTSLTSYDDYQELVDRNDLTWESPTITNNRLTALKEL